MPLPRCSAIGVSPAAVTMFTPPGRIRLVPLCVSVNAPEKVTNFRMPLGADEPNDVMVVVPVIVTEAVNDDPKSVVTALAMLAEPPPTCGM